MSDYMEEWEPPDDDREKRWFVGLGPGEDRGDVRAAFDYTVEYLLQLCRSQGQADPGEDEEGASLLAAVVSRFMCNVPVYVWSYRLTPDRDSNACEETDHEVEAAYYNGRAVPMLYRYGVGGQHEADMARMSAVECATCHVPLRRHVNEPLVMRRGGCPAWDPGDDYYSLPEFKR